ncbi:MAG: hypothetical protein IJZ53_04325 [Tyzzerella sp.]|nr:hypothetical protein [Tyzzerella sp.]
MPIPFEQLSLQQLLHHKLAYDRINEAGKKLLPNWDTRYKDEQVYPLNETLQ